MDFEPAVPAELEIVAAQLGHRPTGVLAVAAHCPAGHPAVIVNHPIRRVGDRVTPFPTLFWLTCPQLTKAISRLEMRGLIDELDNRLENDADLADAIARDHESYRRQRWALLGQDDRQLVRDAGCAEPLEHHGIGGLRNWRSVKCLHLHFAHHLASENTIGALLEHEYGIVTC